MSVQDLLGAMWADYCSMNPAAARIHLLIEAADGPVQNDHIALRTLRHPRLGIDHMARPFLEGGYRAAGEYHFEAKKLYARHYEPADPRDPKVFISELKLEECSADLEATLAGLVDQVSDADLARDDVTMAGRLWDVSHATYETLMAESEYAAWVAAHGFRPNHFTVLVNALRQLTDLEVLNTFLELNGAVLNASGGKIKGSPADMLEQSSTMAELVPVNFSDGVFRIPACYYEFALRHPLPDGRLYQGFVAASADKIFESTRAKG